MDDDLMRALAPVQRKRPLLPELNPRAELALLCRLLFEEGYDDHIAGHISLRQADGTLLINPWELSWDELRASDILRLDSEGRVIEGDWNVTPAVNLHLEVYSRRPDVSVVIHNHSRFGTVWANAQRIPPVYDQTSAQVNGELPLYDEYNSAVSNAREGADCAEALGQAKWVLLANHGVLVVARDIRQAHLRALTLEWRCRQAWMVEALGGGRPIREEVVDQVGGMIDGNGFPFLWEAMARRAIRQDKSVLD
jgi:ribulose-5-phosphate 4-epimerase/fuculose-1-phosphate aldolase